MRLIQTSLFILVCCLPVSLSGQSSDHCACCTAEHGAFDFWIGSWEVFKPDGSLAGTNEVVVLQDSCVLQENWVSSSKGYSGTSYNWYDRSSGLWHQTWIDNKGGSLRLSGGKRGKKMILSSHSDSNGNRDTLLSRITWTDIDARTVRQLWETSADGGRNWKVAFDGLYKRKG